MSARGESTVRLSKALSWLLRHNAEKQGFKLLDGGFLPVEDILKHQRFSGWIVEDVEQVVASCDKQRFALKSEDGKLFIRANQGHSIQSVAVDMTEILSADEAPKVIHGTNFRAWEMIRTTGLNRMRRQHIHFAAGEPGDAEVISGMRKSCQVFIYINIQAALDDGFKFYRSANNVILCPGDSQGILPLKYFSRVKDVKKNLQLYP